MDSKKAIRNYKSMKTRYKVKDGQGLLKAVIDKNDSKESKAHEKSESKFFEKKEDKGLVSDKADISKNVKYAFLARRRK